MDQFLKAFTPEKLSEAWEVFLTEFPQGLWETLYVTILSTLFAILIGLRWESCWLPEMKRESIRCLNR